MECRKAYPIHRKCGRIHIMEDIKWNTRNLKSTFRFIKTIIQDSIVFILHDLKIKRIKNEK